MSKVVTIEADSGSRFISSPHLPVGLNKLGKYKLIYRFATGGMANLYLGRFTGPDGFEKLVAIKIIHDHLSANPEFIRMFVDEARLVSRITHPNVAQIIELGRVGRTYFIAMEYVEGESIGALLRRTRPPIPCAARILADAAAGLHAAHELRNAEGELFHLVHRDVSPQNVLVGYNGSTKVVDFGVAQARGMLHTTKDGSLKGKFGYMAPEQATAQPVDRRADVFVLGILLYELTTRTKLFKATSDAETLARVLQGDITPPSALIQDYPAELEQIVRCALQPRPDDRYQTAQQMQEAIERFIVSRGEPVLPAHVGQVMAEVFSDRVAKKQQILRSISDDTLPSMCDGGLEEVPDVDLERTSSSTWFTRFTGTSVRRKAALLVGLAAVLTTLTVAGYLLLAERSNAASAPGEHTTPVAPSNTPPPASRPTSPLVSISVSVTPASAELRFDATVVKNPFEHHATARDRMVEVLASAPGYQSKSFRVSMARDSRWVIELSPLPRGEATPPRKPRGERRKLNDRDVLVNPYQ